MNLERKILHKDELTETLFKIVYEIQQTGSFIQTSQRNRSAVLGTSPFPALIIIPSPRKDAWFWIKSQIAKELNKTLTQNLLQLQMFNFLTSEQEGSI